MRRRNTRISAQDSCCSFCQTIQQLKEFGRLDDVSEQLNRLCFFFINVTHHFNVDADVLVIFSPCSAALQHLLSICFQCGADFNIRFNVESIDNYMYRGYFLKNSYFLSFVKVKMFTIVQIIYDIIDDRAIQHIVVLKLLVVTLR